VNRTQDIPACIVVPQPTPYGSVAIQVNDAVISKGTQINLLYCHYVYNECNVEPDALRSETSVFKTWAISGCGIRVYVSEIIIVISLRVSCLSRL
jgi:hypothetical protein